MTPKLFKNYMESDVPSCGLRVITVNQYHMPMVPPPPQVHVRFSSRPTLIVPRHSPE
jgi:hypothetical protein